MFEEFYDIILFFLPYIILFSSIPVFLKFISFLFGSLDYSSGTGILDVVSEKKDAEKCEETFVSDETSVGLLDEPSQAFDTERDVIIFNPEDKFWFKSSYSRDLPLRCPNCWGIADDSGVCQYCGSRLV